MKESSQAIGVFDSGIGGLTVANSISTLLPREQLIYFGDTEHMPYGDKSESLIKEYSIKISKYLIEQQNCKAIVIACNSASSSAYNFLKEKYLGEVPIINVIDPMVEFVKEKKYSEIGIIATRRTIETKIYEKKLAKKSPNCKVRSLATPLLASMIEENSINDEISQTILKKYLSTPKFLNIEALVLACTHYPLIKNQIHNFFNAKVEILTVGKLVAEKLKGIMEKENLLNTGTKRKNKFLVSNKTSQFETTAKKFYGEKIILKEIKLNQFL